MFAALALICAPAPAMAAEDAYITEPPGIDVVHFLHIDKFMEFGPVGYDSQGRRYYCIEQNIATDYSIRSVEAMPDSVLTRTLGELLRQYQYTSNLEYMQPALAYIVHEALDTSDGEYGWSSVRDSVQRFYPAAITKAEELYTLARAAVPTDIATRITYTDGKRAGIVHLDITNIDGAPTSGTEYELELEGDAVFTDGTQRKTGVTDGTALEFGWRATDEGNVRVRAAMQVQGLDHVTSAQDFIRLSEPITVESELEQFDVHTLFSPSLVTQTVPEIVNIGDTVTDDVTVLTEGENNYWPNNANVHATGWYFADIPNAMLDSRITAETGELARDFIARLQRWGFTPHAFATATFSHSGQQQRVQARNADGTPYRVPETTAEGRELGTWVWAVERSDQSPSVQQLMLGDWVSDFLEPTETHTVRLPELDEEPEQPTDENTDEDTAEDDEIGTEDTAEITPSPDSHDDEGNAAAVVVSPPRAHSLARTGVGIAAAALACTVIFALGVALLGRRCRAAQYVTELSAPNTSETHVNTTDFTDNPHM